MHRNPPETAALEVTSVADDAGPSGAARQTSPWLPEEHLAPDYPVPYGPCTEVSIAAVLRRIHACIDPCTPTAIVNRTTGVEVTDFSHPDPDAEVVAGAFRLTCYEWGVTYGAMLQVSEVTNDPRFRAYTVRRLRFIAEREPYFREIYAHLAPARRHELAFRGLLAPRNLDDAGSLCAAMIKATRAGLVADLRPLIERLIAYIMDAQFRLADGTLARNRPVPCSLWLDDLYMSVPALAQMAVLTGEGRYFDEAVRQVLQFSRRMFNPAKGLYMHGWVETMDVHPEFHWGRANGWALLAKTELLEVLPTDHPQHGAVLELLRRQVRGLAERQSARGLWHQLLDRNDSYLETSASAIFTYGIARAINRGWIDPLAHGPMVQVAWNALAAQVNDLGQVEGTCVGSGMAMDPMFYYHRPTSPFAAHGYGPVLLAGSEMIRLIASGRATMHDSAVHFGETGEEA